jgi:putative sterol carrier protein
LGDDRFHAEVARGRLELARGSAHQPDAILSAGPDTLAALVYGGRKLAEALRSGDVKVEGDKSSVKRFLALFPLPERAQVNSSRSEVARR